jgi:hypothetical protein
MKKCSISPLPLKKGLIWCWYCSSPSWGVRKKSNPQDEEEPFVGCGLRCLSLFVVVFVLFFASRFLGVVFLYCSPFSSCRVNSSLAYYEYLSSFYPLRLIAEKFFDFAQSGAPAYTGYVVVVVFICFVGFHLFLFGLI